MHDDRDRADLGVMRRDSLKMRSGRA